MRTSVPLLLRPRRRDWCRRLLWFNQHEGGRRALRGDRIRRLRAVLRFLRFDVNAVDVDDAWELAHTFEEASKIVIRPFNLEADRPLRIHLASRNGLWCKTANGEVGLRRHALNAAQQIRDVFFAWEYRAQPFELRFEILHLPAEFRQTARRLQTALIFGLNFRELRLALVDAVLRGLRVEVPEDTGTGNRQHRERAKLAVPRHLAETQVHGHFCVSGGINAALAPASWWRRRGWRRPARAARAGRWR